MIANHYLPKILTAIFAGLFIFTGLYTIGNGLLFDRLFICILIFTAVICRKNINVLGVVVILLLQRFLEETAWSISELDFQMVVKAAFYFLAIFAYWKIKYDGMAKVLLVALILSISAEFYWIYHSLKAVQIYWYIGVLASSLFFRHLIFMRVSFTESFFPKSAESINLDLQIYKVYSLFAYIELFMIVEYVLRGVFNLTNIMIVYKTYPYASQVLSTYMVWVIFNESYKLLLPKLLKA